MTNSSELPRGLVFLISSRGPFWAFWFSKSFNTGAETENAIRRLILEIEKTKRRVNSLEFVMIPRLEKQAKLIAFRLEEMERDSFVMLKTIKRKLEKAGEAAG